MKKYNQGNQMYNTNDWFELIYQAKMSEFENQ